MAQVTSCQGGSRLRSCPVRGGVTAQVTSCQGADMAQLMAS